MVSKVEQMKEMGKDVANTLSYFYILPTKARKDFESSEEDYDYNSLGADCLGTLLVGAGLCGNALGLGLAGSVALLSQNGGLAGNVLIGHTCLNIASNTASGIYEYLRGTKRKLEQRERHNLEDLESSMDNCLY